MKKFSFERVRGSGGSKGQERSVKRRITTDVRIMVLMKFRF